MHIHVLFFLAWEGRLGFQFFASEKPQQNSAKHTTRAHTHARALRKETRYRHNYTERYKKKSEILARGAGFFFKSHKKAFNAKRETRERA